MNETTWRCSGCGKQELVRHDVDPTKTSSYTMPIPPGWVWVPYKSIRFPDRDSRMLGCSVACAKKGIAAARVAMPE